MKRPTAALWWFTAYALFVVYGSLVPLDFVALPLDVALDRFRHIPFLDLGIDSRADWVANAVLYMPLGLLAVGALRRWMPPSLAVTFATLLCWLLAGCVEFAQLYFPPRTVSQNDLLAEAIGSGIGGVLGSVLQAWFARLREGWTGGGDRLLRRLLEAYALAYGALSFFPYDLLLSSSEVASKAASALWSVGLVANERGFVWAVMQLAVEAALAAPLGMLLQRHWRSTVLGAALGGLVLGLVIELGQFFIASGVSQGASVVTRAIGMGAGALVASRLWAGDVETVRFAVRRFAWPALAVYLPMLLFASGLLRSPWPGLRSARDVAVTWDALHWLPFYYHYFTTEVVALFSLGSVALMFLPLAALGWVCRLRPWLVLGAVLLLSVLVEAGKLFITGLRPDPTNPLIAAAAAGVARWLLDTVSARRAVPAAGSVSSAEETVGSTRGAPVSALLLLPVLVLAMAFAATFPVFRGPMAAGLLACAALVWWRPGLALAIVPAAMPVLDLATWSGRVFATEFDALLVLCVAVVGVRAPASPGRRSWGFDGPTIAFALLGVSLALSTARTLWPWPGLDDNSLVSYTSAFNALRVAKGAVLAWLFVWAYSRLRPLGDDRARLFSAGMGVGLALTLACVLWERFTTVGLFDFSADYRVTGPFSAMHRGGAFIECYLAVAAAFALQAVLTPGRFAWRLAGFALLACAGFAMTLTYSRNGYAAFALVLLLGLGLRGIPRQGRVGAWFVGLAIVATAAVAVAPVLFGSYARERLSTIGADLQVRQAHWADARQMRSDDGALSAVVGEGLGQFATLHRWRSREAVRAGSYALLREAGAAPGQPERRFLRLGTGAVLYIEQVLPLDMTGPLRLSVQLRSARPEPTLAVSLCRKWLLTSMACTTGTAGTTAPTRAGVPDGTNAWRPAELALSLPAHTGPQGVAGPWLKFAFQTPATGAAIDVSGIKLVDATGKDWLVNGDFAAGMDRWWFTTDVDPPWHVHSLPMSIWLEQGWLGVAAWAAVLVLALGQGLALCVRRRAGLPAATVAAAAFLVSGTLNTLVDEPRFLWLLLVCLWLATRRARRADP